jgi:pimeloyl-ACP methyl ester carboxylesterase
MDFSAPQPPNPVQFASADGLVLSGTRQPGSRRQPQILLSHGFGQTRHSWAGSQHRLGQAGFGSLAWDTRGHGATGRNPTRQPYIAADFIGDMAAAARLVGGEPVLVGASMGGLTGLLAQAQAPLFSALVLVDVTPRWEAAGMQRIQAFMTAHPTGFDSYDHAAGAIADYLPHRRGRKTEEQLSKLLHIDAGGRLRWHWDPRLLAEFVAGSQQLQESIAEAARRVRIPVLLVSGGRSDLVSDDTVAHFLELVPHAGHVRLPEATHMLAGDDNDAFTETVLAFLRAQFPNPVPDAEAFGLDAAAPAEHLVPGVTR